ncbi:N-glycosyltransferase [Oerskovia enterophila]|uniref:N-glycosyltransferase n=1 Tax=Oerskovia enterophila TaxID=43678 RepID=A0ABX2Y2C0_9CELL|nr:N-glycosyltransferase [Oerskovia enterophila]
MQSAKTPSVNRLWPRSTSIILILVGVVLATTSFLIVINMPPLVWHSARTLELQSIYTAYQQTGTLLIKATGSGSSYTQVYSPGEYASAAWDDDPGSYIVASLMGHLTHSDSPFPGLGLAQAFLVALPLLWLPTAVARIFKRARAGYAIILLPAVMWLTNNGTVLAGTEYGLSDASSPTRVYALYGIAASMAFLSLTLLVLACTFRFRTWALVLVSLGFVVLAAAGNLSRSLSGVGIALGVGVLWWLHFSGRLKWLRALGVALVAVVLAAGLQSGIMSSINSARSEATGQSMSDLPNSHGTWHPLYLGLSFPQPITGEPSPLGIEWSDEFGWNKAWEVNPDAAIASVEYDQILKTYYLDEVKAHPGTVAKIYAAKLLFVIKHFGAMLILIGVALFLALTRRSKIKRTLGSAVAVTIPTLLLGLVPPVLVMPLLYYYSELAAGLSVLVAISIGALAWSLTSMPSHVRASERSRIAGRLRSDEVPSASRGISVVVPTRNGAAVIGGALDTLGSTLTEHDEVLVVENGSTDKTTETLEDIARSWSHPCRLVVLHSRPGLGEALRTGVLASKGQRVLLTADDLPFGLSDFEEFVKLPQDVVVAIGSKAHPDSQVTRSRRRAIQSRIFRFLRSALLQSKVGDSQGTIWADGDWCRSLAVLSHESGLMWTTELVLAAEQQGITVVEVPVVLSRTHEAGSSRFRAGDAVRSFIGFVRLAIYKDDYVDEVWIRSTESLDDDRSTAGSGVDGASGTAAADAELQLAHGVRREGE